MSSILDRLMKALGTTFLDGEIRQPTRIWVTIRYEAIYPVVEILKRAFGISRVAMITGLETPQGLEILYHFERINEVHLQEFLTIKINVPQEDPTIEIIVSLIPSANFYEVELQELFGIKLNRNSSFTE